MIREYELSIRLTCVRDRRFIDIVVLAFGVVGLRQRDCLAICQAGLQCDRGSQVHSFVDPPVASEGGHV